MITYYYLHLLGCNKHVSQVGHPNDSCASLNPATKPKIQIMNEGIKNIIIPATTLIPNALALFLISSSLLAVTAFPKSNAPNTIIIIGIVNLNINKKILANWHIKSIFQF